MERRMLAAIMFTDIQGFTEKMNMRESLGLRFLQKHNEIMDGAVKRHNGRVVKTLGDSYLVAFESVVNAARCALEAQEAFDQANREDPMAEPLLVRISIHLGDVVVRRDDILGDGVNVAAHLQEVTPGGAVCVSQEVYAQVRGKISGGFKSLGFCRIKGIAEPIEVFRLVAQSQSERFATPAVSRPATAVIMTRKPRRSRFNPWWALAAFAVLALVIGAWFHR